MNWKQISTCFLAFVLLVPVSALAETTFANDCRNAILELLAKQQANRDKIKTLEMTGTFEETIQTPRTRYVSTRLHYEYKQSGIKRRIDLHYDLNRSEDGKKFMHEGRTAYWAHDGKHTLSYISDTELIAINNDELFDFQNPVNWLDDTHRGLLAHSHANFIRWLMNRPTARPGDRDVFAVVQDASMGRALQAIEFRLETPDARSLWRWVFDLGSGYEVIKVINDEHFKDGSLLVKRDATYTIREVAPGIYRAVGVTAVRSEESSEARIVINNLAVSCNGPAIAESTFTFQGFGLKRGTRVFDVTTKPSRPFMLE